MKLMTCLNINKDFLLVIEKLFVMLHLLMIGTCNRNLPWQITWHHPLYTGSMQCLAPFPLVHVCYAVFLISPPAFMDVYWMILMWQISAGTLLVLLGKKWWPNLSMASIKSTWWCGVFALRLIDTTTSLVKVARMFQKSSNHIATGFEHTCLSKYQKTMQVIHDNGGEFTGFAFQQLLQVLIIKTVPTTNENTQSNAICEQMHQTVLTVTVLKMLLLAQPPQTCHKTEQLVDYILVTVMHALHSTVSTTL